MPDGAPDPHRQSDTILYRKQAACQIRVIALYGGKNDEPIRMHLHSTCLNVTGENRSRYKALTYTWSHEERDVEVVLNDEPFMVTKQLRDFFLDARQHLPDDDYDLWWIDQICINQDDEEDKLQQLANMRRIFEQATFTMIWLYPGFDHALRVHDLIERLDGLRSSESGYMLENVPMETILEPSDDDNLLSWSALHTFMSHRYWTRTWILPEATAQVDRCVIIGTRPDTWLRVHAVFWTRNLLRALNSRDPNSRHPAAHVPSSFVGRVENFAIFRHGVLTKDTNPLLRLLSITRRTECERPEDKIFAVISFAADVGDFLNDEFLKPSYMIGCGNVYANLVKWYVKKYRNLDFLGYCTTRKASTTQIPGFDLPSWVPNWTHASFLGPFRKYDNPRASVAERVLHYSACGPFSHSIDLVEPPSIGYQTDKLFLSGLRIATVHRILDAVPDGGFWDADIQMSWQDDFGSEVKYPLTEETYLDAFERTVMADSAVLVGGGPATRPGRVKWWRDNETMSMEEKESMEWQVQSVTRDRRLFFARSSHPSPSMARRIGAECGSYVMGIGRSDIAVGDEVWALKGGKVLYILRRRPGHFATKNIADEPEPGWPSFPSLLLLNGKTYPWSATLTGSSFQFVGECYVHGLMDGEALEMAAREEHDRSEVLTGMASEFEDIFVGGVSRWTFEVPKSKDTREMLAEVGDTLSQAEDGLHGDTLGREFVDKWEVY